MDWDCLAGQGVWAIQADQVGQALREMFKLGGKNDLCYVSW